MSQPDIAQNAEADVALAKHCSNIAVKAKEARLHLQSMAQVQTLGVAENFYFCRVFQELLKITTN